MRASLLCLALVQAGGDDGLARSASSSGGYSRPSTSSYSAPSRRPASGSSGGYSRPSGPSVAAPYSSSGGDQAVSRRNSSQSYQDYRASQVPAAPAPTAPSYQAPSAGYGYAAPRRPDIGGWGQSPQSAYGGGGGSGFLTGALLGGLLGSLASPGRAQFFHDNQNDPAYQQWRAQQDQQARQDPALAARLSQLDTQLGALKDQPRTPGVLPPDLAGAQKSSGGGGLVWLVLLLGAGLFVMLWLWRRRAAQGGSVSAPKSAPPGLGGSAASRFRVGMTIPVDPAPFVLAAGVSRVQPPETGGLISIEALGLIADGGVALHRLYLPGRKSFFLLHLGADGRPDECRYFSQMDEVTPASQDEWGAWLDPAQGMIGWPEFQTKDGRTYGRAWAPGASRIAPRAQQETLADVQGTTTRQLQSMLYAAPTGAAVPAPTVEYLLVSAVDSGAQAWVEIAVGIDINPAALTLPAVPLDR